MSQTKIICPNCSHQFNAEESIAKSIEEKYKLEFQEKQNKILQEKQINDKALEEKMQKLIQDQQEFEIKRKKALEDYNQKLEIDKLKIKEELKVEAEKKANEESELKFKSLLENLEKEKAEKLELQKKELVFLQKERDLKEKEEQLEIKLQKQIIETKNLVEEQVKRQEAEKFELVKKEYQKKMDDQQKLIEEMKRKNEQGSMQLQGEVQELAIEEILKNNFPFDIIDEVSKGIRGADCIQTVRNNVGVQCGKIIYESKRTKAFANEWIDKLKEDMRLAGAEIAVLVTETLPKDQVGFDLVNGVWVCTYQEFKSLVIALREGLIRLQKVQDANENKGDKMQMLYSFLTGNEFKSQVEAIIEGFTALKDDLEREKRDMQNIWKKREKQIEKVITNTINMYGSVEGIAGSSVTPIKSLGLNNLELGSDFDEEIED